MFTGSSRCTLWQAAQNSAESWRMKAFMKVAAVRLRIEVGDELVDLAQISGFWLEADRCSGGYSMVKSPLPMRAVDVHDGVAGHATQAVLRFGRVDLLLDGTVEAAVEEDRVIVTSGAPFAALRAAQLLHVLDGLPVELIVERREVVHGALPLLVDVLVALAAQGFESMKKSDGMIAPVLVFADEGQKGDLRPAPSSAHGERNGFGIANAVCGESRIAAPAATIASAASHARQRPAR